MKLWCALSSCCLPSAFWAPPNLWVGHSSDWPEDAYCDVCVHVAQWYTTTLSVNMCDGLYMPYCLIDGISFSVFGSPLRKHVFSQMVPLVKKTPTHGSCSPMSSMKLPKIAIDKRKHVNSGANCTPRFGPSVAFDVLVTALPLQIESRSLAPRIYIQIGSCWLWNCARVTPGPDIHALLLHFHCAPKGKHANRPMNWQPALHSKQTVDPLCWK